MQSVFVKIFLFPLIFCKNLQEVRAVTKNGRYHETLVYRGPEKIGLEDVPVPQIIEPDNAIVRVTTSTICGTDYKTPGRAKRTIAFAYDGGNI